jgi:electron transfer flavoprotein alpha subunit
LDADAGAVADEAGQFGAVAVHQAQHDLLGDYGPEAWGHTVAALVAETAPRAVLAPGSERGNEVLAHAAARMDLPLATNAIAVEPGDGAWSVTRLRWGGSLLEQAALEAPVALVTIAPHAVEAVPAEEPARPVLMPFTPDLDPALARTVVRERVVTATGITLATAPVVVGGGRGVGSEEGFAPLERLADLLGGVVGCSRVVTNQGWRPHSDQVGQTGTQIAPQLYIACGISGAVQHWAGAKSSKHVLAINADPEANMVTQADFAVIGDLHEVVPAIIAEIERVRG